MEKKKRDWLNKDPGMRAYVISRIDTHERGWFSASLEIGDCNRQVTLDFGMHHWGTTPTSLKRTKKQYEQAKAKLIKLREYVDDMENELTKHWTEFETKGFAEFVAKEKERKKSKPLVTSSLDELLDPVDD